MKTRQTNKQKTVWIQQLFGVRRHFICHYSFHWSSPNQPSNERRPWPCEVLQSQKCGIYHIAGMKHRPSVYRWGQYIQWGTLVQKVELHMHQLWFANNTISSRKHLIYTGYVLSCFFILLPYLKWVLTRGKTIAQDPTINEWHMLPT